MKYLCYDLYERYDKQGDWESFSGSFSDLNSAKKWCESRKRKGLGKGWVVRDMFSNKIVYSC